MAFGFERSRQRSRSESSSFDNLDQIGFDLARDESRSESGSTQRIAFQNIFQNLFGGASATAAGIDTSGLSGAANMLFGAGSGFLADLQDDAGTRFLEGRLAGGDSLASERIDLLQEDIGRFLTETVNPAIASRGVQANTLGGGRGEVARGIAAEGATREFARGALDIRQAEQEALDAIAGQVSGDAIARTGTAVNALPGLFGLAEAGTMASLSPFAALASILGGPTVLTESSSLAEALGLSLGFDQTTGRAASRAMSESEGSSTRFGFSPGP